MKATAYSDQKNWSDTYLTDPEIVRALGPFDMDPCCPPTMPWVTAGQMVHVDQQSGLEVAWYGRIFMNPPYRGVLKWAQRFVFHGMGIALLNGRSVETRATQLIMRAASGVWFPEGRLTFFHEDGSPYKQKWFGSVLLGLTTYDARQLQKASEKFGGAFFINGQVYEASASD